MSSLSSATPRNNRRMTLSTLPPNSARRSVDKTKNPNADSVAAPKNSRLPPKGRVSMIPRMGRENYNPPPSTPNSAAGSTTSSSAMGSTTKGFRRNSNVEGDHMPSRRQSLLPPSSGGSVGQRADPRPILDKAFQHQCIKELLSFLQELGYEYPVSTKSLSRPSAKDFTNMTTFLLRQVDKDFQRGGMKFEDEVALNFKCMGYPYPISKTALVAAGTPHTWPSLLAALNWLIHQIQCKSADQCELESDATKDFSSIADLETQTDKAFFLYMGQAYSAFMQGDASSLENLETAFMQRFERDDAFLAQAVERVTDLNASIVERMNDVAQQCEELPVFAKKRENYATDVEQFHDLYRQMVEHKKQFQQKVEERTTELAKVNEKLDKMTVYINDLKKTIGEQEFSVHDIHKMESELKGLTESTDRAVALRDQKRKDLFAVEAKLASMCNDLDSKVAEFSGKIAELRLVPDLGSKFHNMQASVNKDKLIHADLRESLGVDLNGYIHSIAVSSKEEYLQKVDDAKLFYHKICEQTNHLEDSCKEAEAKLKIFGDKVQKCEQTLESERKTQDATIAVREREVESLEKKIASLQDPVALEEQMAAYERQCAELQALRFEREENNMAQKRAVLIDINNACQIMADHDAYLERQISELKQYVDEQTKGIGGVVIPSNIANTRHI